MQSLKEMRKSGTTEKKRKRTKKHHTRGEENILKIFQDEVSLLKCHIILKLNTCS